MSIEPKLSRFSVLPDDVSEPVGKKSSSDKPKKKKPTADQKGKGGAGDASKKKASAAKGKVDQSQIMENINHLRIICVVM